MNVFEKGVFAEVKYWFADKDRLALIIRVEKVDILSVSANVNYHNDLPLRKRRETTIDNHCCSHHSLQSIVLSFDDVEFFSGCKEHTVFASEFSKRSIAVNVLTENDRRSCNRLTDFFFNTDDRFEFFDQFWFRFWLRSNWWKEWWTRRAEIRRSSIV